MYMITIYLKLSIFVTYKLSLGMRLYINIRWLIFISFYYLHLSNCARNNVLIFKSSQLKFIRREFNLLYTTSIK